MCIIRVVQFREHLKLITGNKYWILHLEFSLTSLIAFTVRRYSRSQIALKMKAMAVYAGLFMGRSWKHIGNICLTLCRATDLSLSSDLTSLRICAYDFWCTMVFTDLLNTNHLNH